jgi:hypothetical protein
MIEIWLDAAASCAMLQPGGAEEARSKESFELKGCPLWQVVWPFRPRRPPAANGCRPFKGGLFGGMRTGYFCSTLKE